MGGRLPRFARNDCTLSWINRCRRLAKDWEASIASPEAWLLIASIRQLFRRLARLASANTQFNYGSDS
ncbi:MAG: hypothetical protein ACT4O2_16145, partial [Beijerinckiaceae bacterium]